MRQEFETAICKIIQMDRLQNKNINTQKLSSQLAELILVSSGIKINEKASLPLSMMELLCLIFSAFGKKSEGVAWILGVKPSTVNTYFDRIREKLGAKNKLHAFYIAVQKGYITVDSRTLH